MLTLRTPPRIEPISLSDVKHHLAIGHGEDDVFLHSIIIPAARNSFELRTGRQLITATWTMTMNSFPVNSNALRLPLGQFQGVDEIRYTAADDTVTVYSNDYSVRVRGPMDYTYLLPPDGTAWPTGMDQVEIDFTCGWESAVVVPVPIKMALLQLCHHYYEQRDLMASQGSVPTPQAFEAICRQWDLGDEWTVYGPGQREYAVSDYA